MLDILSQDLPVWVIHIATAGSHNRRMTTNTLAALSEDFVTAVATIEPSVVQVHGRRRSVSGVAYAPDSVITSARALGREDGVRMTRHDGHAGSAELVGWDPASGLAILRAEGLELKPAATSPAAPRVGQIALAAARSWSNALTASAGIVAVIGGPLRTGRGQSLEQIIRVTAPLHDGFAGGAVIDATGGLIGVATAARIRGFAVVIPAAIAWKSAAHVIEHGRPKVGFVGLSGYAVELPERQRVDGRTGGLLVIGVAAGGPAEAAGILVGDLVVALDDRAVASTDDLLALLTAERIGRAVTVRVLRGGAVADVTVTVAERRES
jgi:serine protease Do